MMKLYIDHNQPFDRYHPKNFLNLSDLTFTWTSKSAVIISLQWLSIALIFCLVYTVRPYYTGTQNTYFLHGLADAGYGLLKYDWLSNTKDTRPFFSFMIKIIYPLFNIYGFYILYLLLAGIYINSIIAIINYAFNNFFKQNWAYRLLLITGLLLIHAKIVHNQLRKLIGLDFESIFLDGMANHSGLNHYLKSSAFGLLIILSILLYLKNKYYMSVFIACLAASVHLSFLLPAGLITLSCMIGSYYKKKNILKSLALGFFGVVLVLPTILYTFQTFIPLSDTAKDILYYYRIPHHANPHAWLSEITWVKLGIMILALLTLKRKDLILIFLILFSMPFMLTTIQYYTESKSLALLLPWRTSVILVPLSTCLLLGFILRKLILVLNSMNIKPQLIIWSNYILISLLVASGSAITIKNYIKKKDMDGSFRDLVSKVNYRENEEFCIMVPLDFQDFRLATGFPIYIDYFSHPYQSDDLEEWYERVKTTERFYQQKMNKNEIEHLFLSHNITYVITYKEEKVLENSYLIEKYANNRYILSQIKFSP